MQTLAILECNFPQTNNFIVRGTVPIPPGMNIGDVYTVGINSPFTLVDQKQQELPTQCQVVAKYPNGDTAVVELSAVASKSGLTAPANGKLQFRVIKKTQTFKLPQFDEQLFELATTDDAVRLRARDVHGNLYETSISRSFKKFEPHKKWRWYRVGEAMTTLELPQWLQSPGTHTSQLYLGGVHAWMSARNNSRVLSLDLNFHNGGLETANGGFFILDDIYFESLELVMPTEWDVLADWPEPTMGASYIENGERVVPLVEKLPNGKMNILPQRFEREWRLQLFLAGDEIEAREIAENKTVAIAIDGQVNGRRLYNWNNPETARYLAQAFPTPDMSHVGNIAQYVKTEKNKYNTILKDGLPHGPNSNGTGQIGYFNPHGAQYGGESGGEEIWQWPGIEIIGSRNISDGITWTRAVHRSVTDRHWGCIYFFSGQPTVLDSHLSKNGKAPWDIFNSKFFQGKDLPWDFKNADDSHVNFVANNGLKPPYEGPLKGHDPQDYQHYCRRTWPAKILVWLENDHIAKNKLQMVAELARMTYLTGPGEELDTDIQFIKQFGTNIGTEIGRGDGWVFDACATAYAVSHDLWRQRWLPWFEEVHDIMWDAQTATGMWQALPPGTKPSDSLPGTGKYRACQAIEHGILCNATRGMLKSVFEGVDIQRDQESRIMITSAATGMWDFAWAPGKNAPWRIFAIGVADPTQGVFDVGEIPADGHSNNTDNFQIGSTLAYGLEEAGSDSPATGKLLAAVAAYTSSGNPLGWLQQQQLKNIQNRAPLLAYFQNQHQWVQAKNHDRPKKRRSRPRRPRR